MQALSSQSSSGLVLGRSVVFRIIEEELPEEEEAPLIKKGRRSSTIRSAEDSTLMNQEDADQGMGLDLHDFEPIAGKNKLSWSRNPFMILRCL